jgi:hypothetical protein
VANEALATILARLFADSEPAGPAIAALHDRFASQFAAEIPPPVRARSTARGRAVGMAIDRWSGQDGYEELHACSYVPPAGEGLWVPTPPAFLPPLEPCWGQMPCFALPAGETCDPGPPLPYSEVPGSPFYGEGLEVYDTVNHLTAEQRTIALFWADGAGATGTPAGHSMMIAAQCLGQYEHRLDVAAETFAKVGIAVRDAFISCWYSKYEYNVLRPITYIHDVIDPTWTPFLTTPPFPEYTSGHSVQSAAVAEVLTALFGEVPFIDHTHDDRGFSPRSFPNFFAAAEEAAISRLYGGIHFRTAIERGLEQGRRVGRFVDDLGFRTDPGAMAVADRE